MKISKVDHVRSAVAKQQKKAISGILYSSPSKSSNSSINIEQRLTKLLGNAKRLYNPFNKQQPYKNNPKLSDSENDIKRREKNKLINITELGNCLSKNLLDNYSAAKPDIAKLSGNVNNITVEFDELVSICRTSLKKSLSRTINHSDKDTKNVTYDIPLLFAKLIAEKLKIEAPRLTQKEYLALAAILSEDKYKKRQKARLIKSIEGNNVRVQVDKSGDSPRLVLASYLSKSKSDGKKYHINKKALFDYLKQFASLDSAGQNAMIRNIRCLVLLFVCGSERYESAKGSGNLTAWTWGGWLPDKDEIFNQEAFAYWQNACAAKAEKNNTSYKSNISSVHISLNQSITDFFRQSAAVIQKDSSAEAFEQNIYWLKFFQTLMTRYFQKDLYISDTRFTSAYLCRTIFREWLAFAASKFVDLGKGVYHFAMPKEYDLSGPNNIFGKVQPKYIDGITSFDYERIKAEENLKRDLSVSATYAAAIFGHNVVTLEARKRTGMEDVLGYDKENIINYSRRDAVRRILQFFGGKSRWDGATAWEAESVNFISDIKRMIKVIRNSNFHYSASPLPLSNSQITLAKKIFEQEHSRLKTIYTEKYYSNNVPLFYKETDIKNLLTHLYSTDAIGDAQIPAFNRVFPRKDFPAFTKELRIETNLSKYNASPEILEKYRSAVYFLLKEIYYRDFITKKDLAKTFKATVKKYQLQNQREKYPFQNFQNRIQSFPENFSFANICQQIMTDINMQNQGQKSVKTIAQKAAAHANGNKEGYSHLKILLYKIIRQIFTAHLNNTPLYQFLKSPINNFKLTEKITNKDYCSALTWQPQTYSSLKNLLYGITKQNNTVPLAWYITAHFLPPKKLNELKGNIKSYIQYVHNINSRSSGTGNRCDAENQACDYYSDILYILDFVAIFNGRISNDVTDYFSSEDDYRQHLQLFFEQEVGKNIAGPGEIFFDEQNPIINRGIALSAMYGLDNILSDAGYKITEDYYNQYKKLSTSKDITRLFTAHCCKNKDEQEQLVKFQQMKNRIELCDLLQYVDLIIDHMAQMVSYAYFRERDMMYFQLGLNYLRLYHCSNLIPANNPQRTIKGENISIKDGALLYEIVASYDFDLPIIVEDKKDHSWKPAEKKTIFLNVYGENIYVNGLQLFEKLSSKDENGHDEHDNMREFRNSIDHLKYITGCGMSIMDFYSTIYNGFFRYDTKLQKSISYIFKNIMLRYFLNVNLLFKEARNGKYLITAENISSAKSLYKFPAENNKKANTCNIEAKSKEFINVVTNLLNWNGNI